MGYTLLTLKDKNGCMAVKEIIINTILATRIYFSMYFSLLKFLNINLLKKLHKEYHQCQLRCFVGPDLVPNW